MFWEWKNINYERTIKNIKSGSISYLQYVIIHDMYTLKHAGISWYGDMT